MSHRFTKGMLEFSLRGFQDLLNPYIHISPAYLHQSPLKQCIPYEPLKWFGKSVTVFTNWGIANDCSLFLLLFFVSQLWQCKALYL